MEGTQGSLVLAVHDDTCAWIRSDTYMYIPTYVCMCVHIYIIYMYIYNVSIWVPTHFVASYIYQSSLVSRA